MSDFFDVTVPLIYNPELLGGTRKGGWWIVAEGDEQLGKYLRTLYKYHTYNSSLLIRPAWKEHITVVRDEEPKVENLVSFWYKWSRQKVRCRILLKPEQHGPYWSLPVISESCLVLRQELGLSRQPDVPLHLTFGHTNV